MAHTLHINSGVHAGEYTKDTLEELEAEVKKFGLGSNIEETVAAFRVRGNVVFLTSDPVPEVETVVETVVEEEPVKVKKASKKKVK